MCALAGESGTLGGTWEGDGPLGEVSGRAEEQPAAGSRNGARHNDACRSMMDNSLPLEYIQCTRRVRHDMG